MTLIHKLIVVTLSSAYIGGRASGISAGGMRCGVRPTSCDRQSAGSKYYQSGLTVWLYELQLRRDNERPVVLMFGVEEESMRSERELHERNTLVTVRTKRNKLRRT